MPDALFEIDDFAPLAVKSMRCAACIGSGQTMRRETCPRCGGIGRLGSSIWRGALCLTRITVLVEVGGQP